MKTRETTLRLETRSINEDARTVSGLAIPYEDEIELFEGYFETVAKGAYKPLDETKSGVKLFWQHSEPIGTVTELVEAEDGLHITARISKTPRGDEAYQLVKDGVIDRFSIGFIPLESTETSDEAGIHVLHRSIEIREVSLVSFPAYEKATVQEIRSARKENPMTDSTIKPATIEDVAEVRSSIDDLSQAVALLRASADTTPAPADTRSAGEVLKALAAGDEATISQVNDLHRRAWNGTTSAADSTMTTPAWIGDLTRLFNAPDPLKGLFSTAPLPAEGMSVEYTELKANSITVAKQASEGADLAMGKIETQEKTAKVETFGGYTSLSRQAIERSRVNILNHHMVGMTLAAAKASAENFATHFATAVKSQASTALSVAKAASALTWSDLAGVVVDAAAVFTDQALTLDGLVVDKATFKALAALTGTDGRPLMSVSGTGANTAGTMNLTGLAGDLVGIKVIPNLRQTAGSLGAGIVGAFFNTNAITTYETALVQLQDENIINLTKAFSVYRYSATAATIPSGLVPLKIQAGA
ncbi:HK97 family phage prohead protease [Schaalia sp. ZJ1691]|uniref:HK97 family phage prohead protease n=1 Tax=Schaalia sp. ZJ1691 TaxID=2709404 RepID=UPI0013EA0664|nr:HK97 family phage prohead protease [Schaalia sp. ZJ1691]